MSTTPAIAHSDPEVLRQQAEAAARGEPGLNLEEKRRRGREVSKSAVYAILICVCRRCADGGKLVIFVPKTMV